ncbi:hypothetical protein A7K94_0206395 [Modestobacter sp. VKM Ac-2676]|nr:hypothetical protein A7K94_0206395 [Modestobacter sp. VKM Ac-2676]
MHQQMATLYYLLNRVSEWLDDLVLQSSRTLKELQPSRQRVPHKIVDPAVDGVITKLIQRVECCDFRVAI